MKKIVLSAFAALTLSSVTANAGVTKLYQDANGQVFTQAGKGRTLIESSTSIFSHADKLKFDGEAFFGYKATQYADKNQDFTQEFQVRRGYFQLKAYLLDDPKSYYRVTFDVKNNSNFDTNSLDVRTKYAYLNLNEVFTDTSLEIGLAHRPWHDYEEHNSWIYRSISEVFIENHNSAHISSSADYGILAKTRTKYFDADYGLFNGEGYHGKQNSNGLSLEWRFTGHLLGTHGHPDKNTYADISFFGQLNQKHSNNAVTNHDDDLRFYAIHGVYNQPSFLASAQYVVSSDTSVDSSQTGAVSKGSGSGFSANIEGRLGLNYQYKAFARYDKWTPEAKKGDKQYSKVTEIVGFAFRQNKNVEWVANITISNNEYASTVANPNSTSYMLTTQIDF